jgi:hypothetical protein
LLVRNFGSLPAVWTTCHTVKTPSYPKRQPSERFSSPFGRPLVFDQALGFLSKTQIWEDCCNLPDDVDSCPNALIHKASIVIQIQTSGCQSAWFGSAYIKYGNCVHHINHPNDHQHGPNARSLYMEITCSECTTGHLRPDVALKQERFSAKFLEFWSHNCPSGRRPDAHLNC